MPRKLTLNKDRLTELDRAELAAVAGGVQTLQSGCQSGVRGCLPTVQDPCLTPMSLTDCLSDDLCN